MKGTVFHGIGDVNVEELEIPSIQPFEVLIKVKACGICGSDVHLYKTNFCPQSVLRRSDCGRDVVGHELSGDVVEVGAEVVGFKVGDRVAGVGNGAMAEYATAYGLWGQTLLPIPDDMSYEEAATLEPLADGMRIARMGEPQEGDNIIVFGMGIIGLSVVQSLLGMDISLNNIIAVDISDKRLVLAKEIGINHTINASKQDVYTAAKSICGSSSLLYPPGMPDSANVDVIYDCVGHNDRIPEPSVIQQALNIITENGRIVCFGTFSGTTTMDFANLIWRHPKIIGVLGAEVEDMEKSLALMSLGKVNRKAMISHEFPLSEAKAAFEAQVNSSDSIKVIVKP